MSGNVRPPHPHSLCTLCTPNLNGHPPPTPKPLPSFLSQGSLWDFYRQLQADGWSLDANGYTTSFRCVWDEREIPGTGRKAVGGCGTRHY